MSLVGWRRWRSVNLVITTLLLAAAVRFFLFGVYYVPSQSMMPTLLTGDYFLVTRWDFGWPVRSLWGSSPLSAGRLSASPPRVGDVVVFSGVADPGRVFVKRVMGLPGDVVAMRRGLFFLNGRLLPQEERSDFVIPLGPNVVCLVIPGLIDLRAITADGRPGCRFRRYSELLPDGRRHAVLDFAVSHTDDFGPVRVPPGTLFMMGDNRDDSLDSRIPSALGGLGFVPMSHLLGHARRIVMSSDGRGLPARPWTIIPALRLERLGVIH